MEKPVRPLQKKWNKKFKTIYDNILKYIIKFRFEFSISSNGLSIHKEQVPRS